MPSVSEIFLHLPRAHVYRPRVQCAWTEVGDPARGAELRSPRFPLRPRPDGHLCQSGESFVIKQSAHGLQAVSEPTRRRAGRPSPGGWSNAYAFVISVDATLSPPSSGWNRRRRSSGARGSARALDGLAWLPGPSRDVLNSLQRRRLRVAEREPAVSSKALKWSVSSTVVLVPPSGITSAVRGRLPARLADGSGDGAARM